MAPKNANKRAAQDSKSVQPVKVQKKAEEKKGAGKPKKVEEAPHVPKDPLMEGLVDALQRAELPEACKEMLLLMLPTSFTVPVEQRHEIQSMVVGMVGEVVEQMHAHVTKEAQESKAALEVAEGQKTNLEATVLEAESRLSAAGETVQSKEAGLLDATKLESEKQTLFDGAKDVQTKGDSEFEAVKKERETYATGFANSLKTLQESDLEGHEALQHFKVMQPFIGKLALDESLILALPSTCQKKPCDRGSFDKVIMEQLDKALQTHIANLEKTIAGGSSAAAEREAAVQAAEKELNAAKGMKANAQGELSTAQTKRQEASDFLESSKNAVTNIKLELGRLGKAHEDKVVVWTKFESWNLNCFHQLRDKTAAPKQETPPPQEEAAAPKEMVVDESNNAPVTQAGA